MPSHISERVAEHMRSDWRQEFERKMVTPEEAVEVVKSGDRVAFPTGGVEPLALGLALAARRNELRQVSIFAANPGRDFGWYDPGWEGSFNIEVGYVLPMVRDMVTERRCDCSIGTMFFVRPGEHKPVHVLMLELSTPDEHGFCSFGASIWHKKVDIRSARTVIAELDPNLIRTYGDNYIHVSEIDYFVEHVPSGRMPGATDLLGRKTVEPGPDMKAMATNVEPLIEDGDTLQIGVGAASEWLVRLGILNNRHDLGWHSETTPFGIIRLVREGVINGKCKTRHQGKAVCTAVGGGTKEDMAYVHMNPMFELYGADYILDPGVIAAHDNMVSINSAVSIDLTGQIAAESVGPVVVSGTGGHLAFAIGAQLSKGGRYIVVLPSTAQGGKASRIVARLEPGSVVTVPRTLADIVVTEYGVARLRGKTQRERAEALIAITHPDFRAELRREAQGLLWP